jgi:hypothetical protein
MIEICLIKFSLQFDFHGNCGVLLHAAKLRQGTNGFTSPSKEGMLGNFLPRNIRRLRPGFNPRTWKHACYFKHRGALMMARDSVTLSPQFGRHLSSNLKKKIRRLGCWFCFRLRVKKERTWWNRYIEMSKKHVTKAGIAFLPEEGSGAGSRKYVFF